MHAPPRALLPRNDTALRLLVANRFLVQARAGRAALGTALRELEAGTAEGRPWGGEHPPRRITV